MKKLLKTDYFNAVNELGNSNIFKMTLKKTFRIKTDGASTLIRTVVPYHVENGLTHFRSSVEPKFNLQTFVYLNIPSELKI